MNTALDSQLKLDLGVLGDWPEEAPDGYIFSTAEPLTAARYHEDMSKFFRAIIAGGKAYIRCDDKFLEDAIEIAGRDRPEWLCQFVQLRRIESALNNHGHEVKNTHIYFLPALSEAAFERRALSARRLRGAVEVELVEREQIDFGKWAQGPFSNSVHPDKPYYAESKLLAVARGRDGQAIGCAGASSDGEHLWQIGIDIVEGCQGLGIGCGLVSVLTDELLARGTMPYYGTAESHIASQKTALASGYMPAFTEIFSRRLAGR